MLLFEHRVNSVVELRRVQPDRGVEIDVRDYDGCLRLAHDPYTGGDPLEKFLEEYHHAGIIFNTKSAGLEDEILVLTKKYSVGNFFLLDVPSPSLIQLARRGIRQLAVRFSEFEPLEATLALAGLVDWVWVDCFGRLPLERPAYDSLIRHFKICLVSPELQGHPKSWISAFQRQVSAMRIDAVCTDHCADWSSFQCDESQGR